jgi:Fe-S-cluster containining protein
VSSSEYGRTLAVIDQWFGDTVERFPGVIPCKSGCTRCCHGPFDISLADVEMVQAAVADLPPDSKTAVYQQSASQAAKVAVLLPGLQPENGMVFLTEDQFDVIEQALADEPCTLLGEDGSCLIYQSRPFICRMMGLGVRTPAGREIDNACPIQEDFPVYQRLPHQLLDLEPIEDREAKCLTAASGRIFGDSRHAALETTIALCLALGEPSPKS